MNSDESRLRALEQAVDSIAFHVDYIMSDSPSALRKVYTSGKAKGLTIISTEVSRREKGAISPVFLY